MKIIDEKLIQKNLDFYRYRSDIDIESKKKLIKACEEYRKEIGDITKEKCEGIFPKNIKNEIDIFIKLNDECKQLKKQSKSEMLSTLERIRVEKELHAKQEILAESYIELSAITYFSEEIKRIRYEVNNLIYKETKEIEDKIDLLAATIKVLNDAKKRIDTMTSNSFIIKALYDLTGIELSEEQLYRLNRIIDAVELEI